MHEDTAASLRNVRPRPVPYRLPQGVVNIGLDWVGMGWYSMGWVG